ncbi:MAG TPA: amidase [Gemmatimonadaceae bacterium]|nr:amidase [Gemmatimonadaceae bacterium]
MPTHATTTPPPLRDRRAFLQYFSCIGLGSTLLPGVLWAKVSAGAEITAATIAAAEEVAGVKFDDAERAMMVESLKSQEALLEALHKVSLPNEVPPALVFDPRPPAPARSATRAKGAKGPAVRTSAVPRRAAVPSDLEALAFLPVTELAALVKARRVSSLALTEMYLARLRKYDPLLKCVVTLTEERALKQARAADAEIRAGRYRGPLHGIPWGAKDLFAVAGYPTTWGTAPYKDQMIAEDAEVVKRLDAAGAVLVAKLTLGELAMGDVWFGGMTRNPWKPEQGSSGSSAGPASATAAGLVAFALGTETLGSISSPSTRCGTTGLRPTFGRVPRTGAMALSWSMDKAGPLCRSVEDCALVLDAIRGADGRDPAAVDAPYAFDAGRTLRSLRVGYVKSAFERDEKDYPNKAFDAASLDVLRSLGAKLTPVELPDLPYAPMRVILLAEGAAAFDELTRSGRDKEMAAQEKGSWPNTFRTARFIPAVDYVNANRLRSIAIREWGKLMADYDVLVTPTEFKELVATNLTGHPAVILPNGFRPDGTPVSLTFLGKIDGEGAMLEAANAYQRATGWNKRVPTLKV